jgi:hypothetical protein
LSKKPRAGLLEWQRVMVESGPAAYKVSSDLALDHFGEVSLIFLASTGTFIKVNQAAGDLLQLIIEHFGGNAFSAEQLKALLRETYHLEVDEAAVKSRDLLADWTEHRILVQDPESL